MLDDTKNYVSHRAQTFAEFNNMLNSDEKLKHRYYVERLLGKVQKYIEQRGIQDMCEVVKYLKALNFSAPNIMMLILDFAGYVNCHSKTQQINWFSKRDVRELTFAGKNNLISMLLDQYYDFFVQFMPVYLRRALPNSKCIEEIIGKIMENAQKIHEKGQSLVTVENEEEDDDDDVELGLVDDEFEAFFVDDDCLMID